MLRILAPRSPNALQKSRPYARVCHSVSVSRSTCVWKSLMTLTFPCLWKSCTTVDHTIHPRHRIRGDRDYYAHYELAFVFPSQKSQHAAVGGPNGIGVSSLRNKSTVHQTTASLSLLFDLNPLLKTPSTGSAVRCP